ncbi:hypothetical protein [Salmonella enterica]|nr:hypothetical protein [Salmonella enterica]
MSSADQNTARQEEALSKAGFQPDKICVEHGGLGSNGTVNAVKRSI